MPTPAPVPLPRRPRCASSTGRGASGGRRASGRPRPPRWPRRCSGDSHGCGPSPPTSPTRRSPAAFTQLGARVLLPVVPTDGRELGWAVDTGRLAPGRHGPLEPVGPRLGPTAIGTADVVVLPAVAVDRTGVRLGRGGGYYDRALQHVRPGAVLVAVVFDDEFLDELPVEPHDRRVTAVVTPSGGWQALPAVG